MCLFLNYPAAPRISPYYHTIPRPDAPPLCGGPPMTASHRLHLTVDDYVSGVRAGDRATVARAITLVESRKAEHRALAQDMLVRLLPHAGAAHRVGITG